MAKDTVKTRIAQSVKDSMFDRLMSQGEDFRYLADEVDSTEVTEVGELVTQIRVKLRDGSTRYFVVKVSEQM